MSIYTAIKKDHDKHRSLMNTLADSKAGSAERRRAWEAFFYDVKAHAAAEEETLYANLIATQDGQPDSRHAIHEHYKLDKLMDELNEMEMESSEWLDTFISLKHSYEHHMEEEEGEIFETAKEELGKQSEAISAEKFNQRKAQEIKIVDKKNEEALEH